ncbi:Hsp20/alpha crystallin family protein [Bacillus aquiflavi]|uniref:Hsp20/alpha crystallin family protein n=1 Tax=Bacillus aquiflavi TaxID=2672567 RepID=A0A6B3VVD8_9BACI|nr:Hsp20/alpha crystallin family protein [Bacillus aquiflavi]MBA4537974.1 Hsp20/alpha crystallin family protein [Bacillus aquiflavi]NEY82230.1 Hsp20/alpha crystallin family protein [Bacillus aquiflavi]UAC49873.1 Hsp20/alpha crystallin family protein [Bacillus aquiflavi]
MFPWNSLFPFNKDMQKMMQKMKPEDIEKYIEDMMQKMFPSNPQGAMNPTEIMNRGHPLFQGENAQPPSIPLNASVFETHEDVFVRVPIKNKELLKQIRIYHTSNQLILEHIPNMEDKHTITLPALVKKKGARAQYKDEMLEIKISKNIDMQYSEVDVSETL